MPVHSANTTVYKDTHGWTVAEDRNGQVLSQSNTTPETVLQAAFNRRGSIDIFDNEYFMSPAFAGLNIHYNTTIRATYDAKIRVPTAYAGDVLIADPTVTGANISNTKIKGGLTILETGPVSYLWTGLRCKLNHSTFGITAVDFNDFYALGASNCVAIDLLNNAGWITSANFHNIRTTASRNGINFINTVGLGTAPGISTLSIKDFWFQSGAFSEYGIRGVIGKNHKWDNCSIWDMQLSTVGGGAPGSNAHSAQFLPLATDQLVIGGILLHHNLDNQTAPGELRWTPDGHGPNPDFTHIERLYQTNGSLVGSKSYTIPHGMGITPTRVFVWGASRDALVSPITWSQDATNIYVAFIGKAPPPATAGNQNNVRFVWRASVK